MTQRRIGLALLILIGLLIRLFRLTWQPLWWDEGYSVYFATEPLGRMIWLTAHDIHPPLYYALLHSWLVTFQSAQPLVLRLFSTLIGLLALPLLAWLAHLFFPTRPRLPLLATILLVFNPLHLFYSQEVRMYGLAMLLSMASTIFFWQLIGQIEQKSPKLSLWLGYIITASLALYTLYYLALLLLAHFLWAGWHFRQRWQAFVRLLLADVVVAILYLPWLLYAGPKLIQYIGAKVHSDNDTPLTLFNYLSRHLLAFTSGHITATNLALRVLSLTAIALIPLLFLAPPIKPETPQPFRTPHAALRTFLLLPIALAFLLNLRFPFFPEGGERLLLFVLPYFLLLAAAAMDRCWHSWHIGPIALIGFLLSGAAGSWTFYTTPRYVEHDYRPLIQQVVQQGTDADTVLAIFPWQIGYWRAYAPTAGLRLTHGPQPALIAEGALIWGPPVQQALDTALAHGTLWFPEPLSFGSSLPGQIENHLTRRATNLANQWYSTTTRLTAWNTLPPVSTLQPQTADFGAVRLIGAGVAPQQVASANQPFVVTLAWQLVDPAVRYGVTVRLQDSQGRTWAHRDYAPLGTLSVITETLQPTDQVGFITPVGLPPGAYQLVVGVVDSHEQLLARVKVKQDAQTTLAPVATMTIGQPQQPLPPFRASVQTALPQPFVRDGLALLGYAGYTSGTELLAGSAVELALFLQNQAAGLDRQLYISLLDEHGAGVAGWQGWSLPNYPTSAWPQGALVQAPVAFDLPATLPSGKYQLIAGFINPANHEKSPPATLGEVSVHQRQANFTQPPIEHLLNEPVQFGTHARLLGYDLIQHDNQLDLRLHWQVLQTLLPAHHIFVHLDSAAGDTVAQDDGPPHTLAGPAPTGSWQPAEYLTTLHQIRLPASMPPDASLHVGLYIPTSGERRPASVNGASIGDTAQIPFQP